MYIYHEKIRLDPDEPRIEVDEEEWAIFPTENCMEHKPTGLMFVIAMDKGAPKGKECSLFEFGATPSHICKGHSLPGSEQMTMLARSAILLFVEAVGYVKRTVDAES